MGVKHEGTKHYRFKENPLEEEFARAWKEDNDRPNNSPGVLEWSIGNGNQPGIIEQRDATIAASVIQWLGSPVGQAFLIRVLSRKAGKYIRDRLFEIEETEDEYEEDEVELSGK